MGTYEARLKLKVVEGFLAGDDGGKLLARRWSVPEEKVRTWVSHSRLHGVVALQPKRGAYTADFKLQVLRHQDREQLLSRQASAIYAIRNPNQVVVWRRALDGGGVAALEGKRRTPLLKPGKPSSEPPDPDSARSNRALREELERLRAEVANLQNRRRWFGPIGNPLTKSASRPRAEAKLPVAGAAGGIRPVTAHVPLPGQGLGGQRQARKLEVAHQDCL